MLSLSCTKVIRSQVTLLAKLWICKQISVCYIAYIRITYTCNIMGRFIRIFASLMAFTIRCSKVSPPPLYIPDEILYLCHICERVRREIKMSLATLLPTHLGGPYHTRSILHISLLILHRSPFSGTCLPLAS